MDSRIKTTKDFKSVKGIDRIISHWAKDSGLKECDVPFRLSSNDAAYCYSWDADGSRVFLTISIVDDMVRLETWAMTDIMEKILPNRNINDLLKMLGQGPL